ncbi:helix-turn-helix domain-containing protein [Lactiplantibacillus plantarum]|uniref:helix-turn-helix domain-containing protein n=1 Tax=Lactiplantibacillus plantarum TaxID=1590 RepID=UPI001E5587EB|nr:helix-turn-helix domain-containing protein [Lactiplantibacillus plantarum]WGF85354.1 helix-turn-helix domain-containing protein [Lactiplantibacillus plantarum]WGG42679.1 helix-turn-helix domain-containing protein [Lactiplantibacillus plantarum]
MSGKGSTALARAYGISTYSIILDWVHRFERRGIKGLKDRSMSQEYSSQFKVDVLNWKTQNRASLPVTALHFDLSSPSTIWQWERRFKESGIAGLERKRGNSKHMTKYK